MKKEIRRIGIFQTSKVIAIMDIFFGLPYVLVGFLALAFGEGGSEAVLFLFMPAVMFVLGFLFTALFALIYNFCAGLVGGIVIELEEAD